MNQFDAIVGLNNWPDGVAKMEDLQSIVSLHPDVSEFATALKGIVDGYRTMSNLLDQVNVL